MTDAQVLDSLPPASRPFAETPRKRTGRLFGIHRRMAASPVVIATYSGIGAAIAEHGTFDARTRETIALAVGNENGCDYCQAAHTLSARRAGLTDEQILQIRTGDVEFDPKLATLAALARAVASNTGTVPQELRQAALSAGWTKEELDELFAHIAVNIYTNYFNHYAGTELDLPPAPPMPRERP